VILAAPVEAVRAQVHPAPTARLIGFVRIEHALGRIFRVAAGQHDLVARQEIDAFTIEILVGMDIEGEAHLFEPVGEMEIGIELPQRR